MRRVLGFLPLLMILPVGVQAQTPEMEKIQFYVGEWNYEHSSGHGTMVFERFGDDLIYAKEEYTTNAGSLIRMFHVMGYDSDEGVYWWRRFTRSSGGSFFKGGLEGNTWTFTAEGGQLRMVQVMESDGVVNFRWESLAEDGSWEAGIQGTIRKVR